MLRPRVDASSELSATPRLPSGPATARATLIAQIPRRAQRRCLLKLRLLKKSLLFEVALLLDEKDFSFHRLSHLVQVALRLLLRRRLGVEPAALRSGSWGLPWALSGATKFNLATLGLFFKSKILTFVVADEITKL